MNKEPSQVKKSKDEILMQVCNITDKEEWSYVEHITPIQALKAMEEYRFQASSELPSDGITKFTEKEIDAAKSVRDSFLNQAGVERYKQVYMAGEIVMSDQLQPILASHVARILELEEAGNQILKWYDDENDSKAHSTEQWQKAYNQLRKALTPPKP